MCVCEYVCVHVYICMFGGYTSIIISKIINCLWFNNTDVYVHSGRLCLINHQSERAHKKLRFALVFVMCHSCIEFSKNPKFRQ